MEAVNSINEVSFVPHSVHDDINGANTASYAHRGFDKIFVVAAKALHAVRDVSLAIPLELTLLSAICVVASLVLIETVPYSQLDFTFLFSAAMRSTD